MTVLRKSEFRAYVRDTAKDAGKNFDSFDPFQRSQWMTRAFIRTLARLSPGSVPDDPEDLEEAFTDGSCDGGVDFLWRSEGHVLIVQAKYLGSGKTQSDEEFTYFCDVLRRLHPRTGREFKLHQHLKELALDIDWKTDTFDLQFITLGRASQNTRARADQGQGALEHLPDIESRVDVSALDELNLNELLREAESTEDQLRDPVLLPFFSSKGQPPWLRVDSPTGQVAFIGNVKASQLRQLYQKHKSRLFAQNIRNYVGDTSTNKGMIKTAASDPDRFFFYNNGISAIATKIEPKEANGTLLLERFSIVNGAQTVRSLAKAHVTNPDKTASAMVLCRVTQVSLKRDADEESFLDNVTRFNNTQNSVKVSDFRSNDNIQRGLHKKFGGVYRNGKSYWYKNKRTGESNPRRIPIGMEELARSLFSLDYGPIDVYGGTSHLFDITPQGGYAKLFGIDGEVPDILTEDHFADISGRFFLCEGVRQFLAPIKERGSQSADPVEAAHWTNALERRWMVYFVVGELLRARYKSKPADLNTAIRRLSKPHWLDEDNAVSRSLDQYVHAACEMLVKTYRSESKKPDFKHRNWHRSKSILDTICDEVRFTTIVVDRLPYLQPVSD